ncbi:hypothetical protein QFC21_007299 [Naganishia friedmannii]|uniref:Uncharacterized protein n=1 Tax=Naganishia friedmannii TaxID=89922 RepID=A0ACC2UVS4_9TREE|nr:hypothetical protein QFC21_007299 [Naganishia friedmannii]
MRSRSNSVANNTENINRTPEGMDTVTQFETQLKDAIQNLTAATDNFINVCDVEGGTQQVPGGSVNAFKRIQTALPALLGWLQNPRVREIANGLVEFYETWLADTIASEEDQHRDNNDLFVAFALAFQELREASIQLTGAYMSSRILQGSVQEPTPFISANGNVDEKDSVYEWVNNEIQKANKSLNSLEDVLSRLPESIKNGAVKEGDSEEWETHSVATKLSVDVERLQGMLDAASAEAARILLNLATTERYSQGDEQEEHAATSKIHAFTPVFETVDGILIVKKLMLHLKDEQGNDQSQSLSHALNHPSLDLPTLLAEAAVTQVIRSGREEQADQSFSTRLDEITYNLTEELSKHSPANAFSLHTLNLLPPEDPDRLRVGSWLGGLDSAGTSPRPSRPPSIRSIQEMSRSGTVAASVASRYTNNSE